MSNFFDIETTLSFLLRNDSELLLTYKKRGFGTGKWNAPGGKIRPGESPADSAIREIKEETGIVVNNLESLGFIEFVWPEAKSGYNTRCHIFFIKEYNGEVQESEECRPEWFGLDQIPYDKMWDDDKYWYPDVLAGKMIQKRFHFNLNEEVINFEDI